MAGRYTEDKKSVLRMMRGDIAGIYLAFMLGLYPLFTVNGYWDLQYRKWDLFRYGSVVFLTVMAVLGIPLLVRNYKCRKKADMSLTDWFVLGYAVCVIVSYLGAYDKKTALWGIDTWYMGFVTQMLLTGIYFAVSRGGRPSGFIKYLAASVFMIVAGIVILQRFRVDVLGLYEGMSEEIQLNFVTTLGQVTWTSSYISIMLAAAIGMFFGMEEGKRVYRKPKAVKLFWGLCIFTGFACITVLNCDSAVIAMAVTGLILIWLSIGNREKLLRLLEIAMLALFAAGLIGILEKIFPQRLLPIDRVYVIAAGSPLLYGLLAITAILHFLIKRNRIRIKGDKKKIRIGKILYLLVLLLAACGAALLFYLHGKGLFSGSPTENYFRFTVWWGNSRGFIWRAGAAVFADFNWWRKLFGCGPDCFTPYAYHLMGDAINEFWHNEIVPNVHNEWLNAVINYGILGGAAWLGIFVSSVKTFLFDKRQRIKENPGATGAGLAAAAYIAHNILCYQQIIGTPAILLLLAMADACLRSKESA